MRTLSEHDSGRRIRHVAVLLAAVGAALLWSVSAPNAQAKGPVNFELCGEHDCVKKKSMRFTAAMLYGGRLHVAPGCDTRAYTATASFPGVSRERRYLLVASRGLIGEQGRGGYVWWRKVGGARKGVLAKAVTPTGMGFAAEPEFNGSILSLGGEPEIARWRFRSGQVSCAPNGLAGTIQTFGIRSVAKVEVMDPSISESELPSGCSPRDVEMIFDEMLAGANSRDRSRVLRRIAPQPELVSFFLGQDSRSPTGDSGRNYRRPAEIYRYFADQSLRGHRRFLRSALVEPIFPGHRHRSGPFRRPAGGPAANDPVVAVGFTITVVSESESEITLPGKGAINCETGRFYLYGGG